MPHDVFISHSTDDKLVALALCNKLESAGVRCWIAPRDVGPGAEWGKAIVDAISSCRLMVLVFSSKANESRHIRREVQTAFEKDLIVIPFRVENTQPTGTMEYYLGSVHWLDALTPPVENHLMGVVERVKTLLPAAVQEPIPETKPGDRHDKKIVAEDDERFETPNRKDNRNTKGSKSESSFDRSGFSDVEWETLLFTPMWVYSAVVWVDGAPKAYEKEALNRELARAESYEVPLFRQFLEVSRAEWNDLMPRWNADSRNTPDGLRDARRILDAKLSADEAKAFKKCLYQFGRAIAESGGERGQGGGVLQMPKVSFDEQDTLIDIGIMLGLQEGLRPTSPWLASMIAALDERAVPLADKVPAVLESAAPVAPSRPSVVQTSPQPQRPEAKPAEVIFAKPKEVSPSADAPPSISAVSATRPAPLQWKMILAYVGVIFGLNVITMLAANIGVLVGIVLVVLPIGVFAVAGSKTTHRRWMHLFMLAVFAGALSGFAMVIVFRVHLLNFVIPFVSMFLSMGIGGGLSYLFPKRKSSPSGIRPQEDTMAPTPPSEAKKGGNTKPLIIFGSIAVVALLAVTGYFVFRPKPHARTFSNYVSPSTPRPFPSADSFRVFKVNDKESVEYGGMVTEADARKVAEALKKIGYFDGSVPATVLLKKLGSDTIVWFRVPSDNTKVVQYFRVIGGQLADLGIGHPLVIRLGDVNWKLLKEIKID